MGQVGLTGWARAAAQPVGRWIARRTGRPEAENLSLIGAAFLATTLIDQRTDMAVSPFSVRLERSYLLPDGSVGTGCSLEESNRRSATTVLRQSGAAVETKGIGGQDQ
jgi:hypothetical protein